jgi:hypothetical protein
MGTHFRPDTPYFLPRGSDPTSYLEGHPWAEALSVTRY